MHLIKLLTGIVFAGAMLAGCNNSQSTQEQLVQQGCTVSTHGHVCDPADTKKTTVCHIPPGNPANAHTICIGNEAVPAHIANHGDFVGECSCPGDGGGDGDTPDAGTGTTETPDASTPPPSGEDGGIIL